MAEAGDWGVFVDEIKIFATNDAGTDWWVLYFARQPMERLTCLRATLGGLHWHVACDSEEDAGMLRDTMIACGINPKFLAVKRLPAEAVTRA